MHVSRQVSFIVRLKIQAIQSKNQSGTSSGRGFLFGPLSHPPLCLFLLNFMSKDREIKGRPCLNPEELPSLKDE